jgi:hypothetical protein
LLREEPEDWYVLEMPAYNESEDTMLCEAILSKDEYMRRWKLASKDNKSKMIHLANYQQRIVELEGALVSTFEEYDPNSCVANSHMKLYMDYADTGSDYFFACFYTTNRKYEIFIHDVIFTQNKQELYEPGLIHKIEMYEPWRVYVERQGGGKQATKAVLDKCRYKKSKNCLQAFHQNLNKKVKILKYAPYVSEKMRYPKGWDIKWPKFYNHMTMFQAVTDNNEIFDGMDGCCEMIRREQIARRGGISKLN